MKNLIFLFAFLFSVSGFSQEIEFKEYSYSELFQMIENEEGPIFILNNALIKVNPETDDDYLLKYKGYNSDSILSANKEPHIIKKEIRLDNVHFPRYYTSSEGITTTGGLFNIVFEKNVRFDKAYNLELNSCIFKMDFGFWSTSIGLKNENANYFDFFDQAYIEIEKNQFYGRTTISIVGQKYKDLIRFNLSNNNFENNDAVRFFNLWFFNIRSVDFVSNTFNSKAFYPISFEQLNQLRIHNNNFNDGIPGLSMIEVEELIFKDNHLNVPSFLEINIYNNLSTIGINQFKAQTSSLKGFQDYMHDAYDENVFDIADFQPIYGSYESDNKIQNEDYFNSEIEQKSEFYHYYKNKFNTKTANKYYSEIKILETDRIAYEHNRNPTFSTFFKLRINQFLKVFSNYGTEPERAVIVSLYVILFFALIYLFFPNSWDKHGKNRIIDRYSFFFKYMNQNAGIHEVYLEEQKEELMSYDAFKNLITNSKETVPKFFSVTALPMYKWAISGTKLSASILKRIDIMKGTWNELPQKKRIWKSILLVGAFTIAIVYDIFIKMLNALMLSINTFTTLGFGEIPIKGLPRYLAIIQGFIGWFMLTIFSVSLISQLLN